MRHLKFILLALLFLCFAILSIHAQEAITSASGSASGAGGTLENSVGLVFYETQTGTGGSLAAGVQQPFEISVVSVNEKEPGINLTIFANPNPVNDLLLLITEGYTAPKLIGSLYDLSGKLLVNIPITGNEIYIPMKDYQPAVYFLKITADNETVKTFKIIKK